MEDKMPLASRLFASSTVGEVAFGSSRGSSSKLHRTVLCWCLSCQKWQTQTHHFRQHQTPPTSDKSCLSKFTVAYVHSTLSPTTTSFIRYPGVWQPTNNENYLCRPFCQSLLLSGKSTDISFETFIYYFSRVGCFAVDFANFASRYGCGVLKFVVACSVVYHT
jgi:hypothetical protein